MTRYDLQRQRAARERGRRMAQRRWELDRQRRDRLARITAEQSPSRIIRRIIVIEQERRVREAVIWSWDSLRSARRKLREILRTPPWRNER